MAETSAIKIKKILEAGKIVYPATILDAVKDATKTIDGENNDNYGKTLREILAAQASAGSAEVAALEEKLYGKGESEDHVDGTLDEINAAIAAEQERAEGAEGGLSDFIGALPEDAEAETVVGYAEEIVAAEEAARKAQIGELGKVSAEEGAADHTVKSYVDAAIEAVNGDADALEDRVEALEATHAKKTVGEGDGAKEVFKTVAEEVNEAVTDLIDGAPEALDTLKELADWIANQDESGVTDAATLVARVEANAQAVKDEEAARKAQIGDLGKVSDAEDAADHTVQSYVDAKVADLNSAMDDLDVTNNVSEAIAGITVQVDEEAGKVQKPVVAVTAAKVTCTEGTETVAANLSVDVATSVLDGSAISAIKSYVDNRFSTEACTDTTDYADVFYLN